jgi:ubiquinone/menaquinone biosynthesis C-methylase UbiE
VGFYGEQVLPRIINLACGTKEFRQIRDEVCEGLHGDVVEIGFGSGLTVPHLPSEVTGLWAVDPARVGRKLAAKRVAASSVPVHYAGLDGARLDLPDDRFDGAISVMTLCTIPDVDGALQELRRVLKPGATFRFAEHGHSPDPKVARRQDQFNELEKRFVGGCNLNREIDALVAKAGFEIESLRNFYASGPKVVGYMFVGRARNP